MTDWYKGFSITQSPLKVEYILTPLGEDLIPALDILYIWSIRRLTDLNLPIDPDAFKVMLIP